MNDSQERGGPTKTIASYQALQLGSRSRPAIDPKKAEAIALLLAGMGTQYFPLDVTQEQVAMMTIDYIADLEEFSILEIQSAFTAYRRDPKNTKAPTSGKIRSLAMVERHDRLQARRGPVVAAFPGRSTTWWMYPKTMWELHWHESEVPAGERVRDAPGSPWRQPAW